MDTKLYIRTLNCDNVANSMAARNSEVYVCYESTYEEQILVYTCVCVSAYVCVCVFLCDLVKTGIIKMK